MRKSKNISASLTLNSIAFSCTRAFPPFQCSFCMNMCNKKANKLNKWFNCMTTPVCYLYPHYPFPQTLSMSLSSSQNPIVSLINIAIKINILRKYYSKN